MLHILHCPLSRPDLTYISLLIIFCIIEYVTNKTLNLESIKGCHNDNLDTLKNTACTESFELPHNSHTDINNQHMTKKMGIIKGKLHAAMHAGCHHSKNTFRTSDHCYITRCHTVVSHGLLGKM